MNIEKIQEKHRDEIVEIAFEAYKLACGAVKLLPPLEELKDHFEKLIKEMIENCDGFCLLEDGLVIGYIMSYDVDHLFGSEPGLYVPLYAHGAKGDKKDVYNKLYTHFSEYSVSKGVTSHCLTLYAYDTETSNNFFWLGFGLRCVDAISQAKKLPVANNMVIIKKADVRDVEKITELYVKYEHYFKSAPLFMFRDEKNIEDLKHWLLEDNNHLWIALLHGKAVGFMQIENSGETFISEHNGIMNITGAFVESSQREGGIGHSLLIRVFSWMKENGYTLCGVDFESFNIPASQFWNKYFEPYTYSVVRRIDERIMMK